MFSPSLALHLEPRAGGTPRSSPQFPHFFLISSSLSLPLVFLSLFPPSQAVSPHFFPFFRFSPLFSPRPSGSAARLLCNIHINLCIPGHPQISGPRHGNCANPALDGCHGRPKIHFYPRGKNTDYTNNPNTSGDFFLCVCLQKTLNTEKCSQKEEKRNK